MVETIGAYNDGGMRRLALAVIARVVRDYRLGIRSDKGVAVIAWPLTEDGEFWCDLADVSPKAVQHAMHKRRKAHKRL